jgi:hypothetical protein
MNGFFDNTGYVNKRNRKQILILDINDDGGATHLGAGTEFSVDLFEPLIIDSLSEVYLDNFITYNSNISNRPDNSAFVLKINEFNMNSNVASASGTTRNTVFNSLLIPNEHSSTSNNHSMVIQKAKKFNYVCDINPGKISNITGTITNLAGGPMFHGASTNAVFTYALTGIKTMAGGSEVFPLLSGNNEHVSDTITRITISGTDAVNSGSSGANLPTSNLLANTQSTATTLHFSSPVDLDISEFHNAAAGDIVFTITFGDGNRGGGTTGIITIVPASNPDLQLIKSYGRFIAEFSINSRE